ncbi:MET24 protein, partial [Atractosteus spatula]|nr:MET24 protein [Atractosteus spatula]
MSKDKLRKVFAFRLCLLFTAVFVCIQVYTDLGEWAWPLFSGGRTAAGRQGPPRQAQGKRTSAEKGGITGNPRRRDGVTKRQVTYVRTLKRDPTAAASSTTTSPEKAAGCCPSFLNHRKFPRWRIDMQPWASPSHSLKDEAIRFLNYISSPQISCGTPLGDRWVENREVTERPWQICLDERYSLSHRIKNKQCRVYSLGLEIVDKHLEMSLAKRGCEVHCFDPSIKQAHLHDSELRMWYHRISVDWRDPNPAILGQRLHSNTKKLATILNEFGHRKIDVLKADMESAEWKILENLILERVIDEVGQLVFEVHLHWPGFEVSGDDSTVVRYWYSLLKELEQSHFRLFYSHTDRSRPRLFLHQNLFNASSTYTLGWVNTRWTRP